MSRSIAEYLNAHYADMECAKNATELGLHRAYDGHHLLVAALAGRILITHNAKDFITLHDAWMRWAVAWGVAPRHAGILIIPQVGAFRKLTEEIVAFVGPRLALPNEIHAYEVHVGQWVQDPVPVPRQRRRTM